MGAILKLYLHVVSMYTHACYKSHHTEANT